MSGRVDIPHHQDPQHLFRKKEIESKEIKGAYDVTDAAMMASFGNVMNKAAVDYLSLVSIDRLSFCLNADMRGIPTVLFIAQKAGSCVLSLQENSRMVDFRF